MIRNICLAVAVLFASTHAYALESLITVESHYSAKETADRFETIIKDKGFTVFSRIDHQKNAAAVNLALRPTEVIIFGNPNIGTQLMQCNQLVAIDLPQKVLISEDVDNKVWLSYNNPKYIKLRHNIAGCDKVINKISAALNTLSIAATSK
ncbi:MULTISPECIES: DUF302 domain-containing protein [Shewanella]|uniref:DUF302 domain-containing protein n=1 Tax=Shewanella psychromarinicola TaxID=2487742 RepID=A0A3N4E535_9GAMM|nr:DUF302 domain-containing protein [Shewanella psychromarinicola]AZG36151.1 DUF302 domain-containing protein [Shewanella psychromarinicola]MCL1080526.1 DUF302 domain-containing protein [Shewanella psychromarinicola]RPA31842.1 DUF302 domain-containing protein [Shewanella psychromarinicola]